MIKTIKTTSGRTYRVHVWHEYPSPVALKLQSLRDYRRRVFRTYLQLSAYRTSLIEAGATPGELAEIDENTRYWKERLSNLKGAIRILCKRACKTTALISFIDDEIEDDTYGFALEAYASISREDAVRGLFSSAKGRSVALRKLLVECAAERPGTGAPYVPKCDREEVAKKLMPMLRHAEAS